VVSASQSTAGPYYASLYYYETTKLRNYETRKQHIINIDYCTNSGILAVCEGPLSIIQDCTVGRPFRSLTMSLIVHIFLDHEVGRLDIHQYRNVHRDNDRFLCLSKSNGKLVLGNEMLIFKE
jgi:hypothetical protein